MDGAEEVGDLCWAELVDVRDAADGRDEDVSWEEGFEVYEAEG